MANQQLNKKEILRKNRLIERLFKEASSFVSFPYKVVYSFSDTHTSVFSEIAFIVPKRQYKRAVDRNNIKRKMKEAFRKSKSDFYAVLHKKQQSIRFVILYIAHENLEFKLIESKMKEVLNELQNRGVQA